MSMFFKLFGLRYSNPTGQPNFNDKEYLSNLQFARTGDVLVDESGVPISFSAIGIQYGTPPLPSGMAAEETGLWYNLSTNSVWSRTKLSDGVTIVDVDTGPSGEGDMRKSVYDTNDDGIVDAADQLKAGVLSVTATQVITHINNLSIHRALNDSITTTTNLWSAQQISDVVSAATQPFNVGVNGIVLAPTAPQKLDSFYLRADNSWQKLYVAPFAAGLQGIVNAPTTPQADGNYFLRADNTWQAVEAASLDLELNQLHSGDLLMYGPGAAWYNMRLEVGDGLEAVATFGGSGQPGSLVLYNLLTLDQARVNGDIFTGPVYYGEYVQVTHPLQLTTKEYVDNTAGSLANLRDVSLAGLTDGDVLQYSAYEGAWINAAFNIGLISVRPHHMLQELDHDDHTQYVLLAGRAGSQFVFGGTGEDETLFLRGTADASYGNVSIQRSGSVDYVAGESNFRVYDANSGFVGISGTVNPRLQFYDPVLADAWFINVVGDGTVMTFNDSEHDVLTINGVTHDVQLFGGAQLGYTTTGALGMIRYNSGSFQGYGPLGWQTFGGVTFLSQLGDTDIHSPEYGQFLIYDGYNWINAHPVLVTALAELTDVALYEPTVGQFLVYDGSKWINETLYMPVALAGLTDVMLNTPVNGQLLTFDGSKWVNQTPNFPMSLAQLTDVDQVGEATGDLLMRDSTGKWINVELLVGGVMTAQFDEYTRHLVLTASPGPYPGVPAMADLTDVGPITYTAGNVLIADGNLWQTYQMSGDVHMNYLGITTIQPGAVAWTTAIDFSYSSLGDIQDRDYMNLTGRPADDNFALLPAFGGVIDSGDLFPMWSVNDNAYRSTNRSNLGAALSAFVGHSLLLGLLSDDHPQYLNVSRAGLWLNTRSITELLDVVSDYPIIGDLLVFDGLTWHNTALLTSGGAHFTYDPTHNTLTLRTDTALGSLLDIYDRQHSYLEGLTVGDDHTQYVHNSIARTITAQHTFAPATAIPPFVLGANAQGQLVTGLNADLLDGQHASAFQPIDDDLTALAALASTGIVVRSAASTFVTRSVQAGSTKIGVTNGSGTGGNIFIDVNESNLSISNIGGTLPWSRIDFTGSSINDILDVNTDYAVTGNILVFTGTEWKKTTLQTSGSITAVYDGTALTIGGGGGGGVTAHNELTGIQGGISGSSPEHYHLDYTSYLFVQYSQAMITVGTSGILTKAQFLVEQTASGITTTLWAGPTLADRISIRNTSAGNNTISGNGANIEGSSSMTLLANEAVTLVYNGTKWLIFGRGTIDASQWTTAPASSSSDGTKGQVAYDGVYKYECVSTNTWVRNVVERTF